MTYPRVVAALLSLHLVMLGWIACWNSPVCDEVGHLTAGIYQWHYGKFFLYRVNPPLVKLVAAMPAAFGNPKLDWSRVSDSPTVRPEFEVGLSFVKANGPDGLWYYFTFGRLLCLPFTVLGGWMCFLWGRILYSDRSGLVACALWCFSPVVLGWGSTFTPDAAAASLGLVATYSFHRWLMDGTLKSSLWAGVTLGFCELTKTTWIVLFAVWPLIWAYWRILPNPPTERSPAPKLWHLVLILVLGIYVINVGYGFEGTCRTVGEYDFVSMTLTGGPQTGITGNRFRGTLLASIPVPLPYNFVRGIDLQKVDFEKGMESFLCGTWSDRGWWYYYPVACCFKLPLGMLLLGGIAVFSQAFPGHRLNRNEIVLIVPSIIVFVLICSQTGFGRYIRYVLPSLPAAFVLIGKLWSDSVPSQIRIGCNLLLTWSVTSSLLVYPFSLSYFNEIAGGPLGGHRYLLDANIDWGQDLFRLKKWVKEHPEARPFHCIHTGFVSPADVGIESDLPQRIDTSDNAVSENDFVLAPGWYAISVPELFDRRETYRYLQKYRPVGRVGYSTWIYRIPDPSDRSAN